ncbi:solute carrier family 2, facilitated glucose transporter member 1-like [Ptychodera flava]|uniref:solute carrier family 2, facilitated glucose transporter member 1-like n=1 Tax=Ptychodera flava TaxID=63121 RepID=UPI00396A5E00
MEDDTPPIELQYKDRDLDDVSDKSNFDDKKTKLTGWVVYVTAVITCTASLQFGWNTGVMTAPSGYIQDFYNQTYDRYGELSDDAMLWMWAWTISLYAVGGAFGALASPPFADILGRKGGLLLMNVFSISAALMFGSSVASKNFEMIFMGRIVIGFYVGCVVCIVPLYLAEVAPKHLRGAVGVNHQLLITFGILLAEVLGIYVLNSEDNWHILLSITGWLSVLQLFFLPFCPESPRWLLIIDKDKEGATKAVQKYTGEEDVHAYMQEMYLEHLEESKEERVGVTALFTNKNYRDPLIISIFTHMFQQFSGINAVFFYATEIYYMIFPGNTEAVHAATVLTGTINFLTTIVAVFIVERVGRRSLLLYPYAGMVFFTFLVTLALNLANPNVEDAWDYVALCSVYGYIICFAIGPGPIPFVLVAELWSQGPRPAAMSLSLQVNWWSNFIVNFFFPVFQEAMHAYVFSIFMVFLMIAVVFTYFWVPETKNKRFSEIVAEFKKGGSSTQQGEDNAAFGDM